MLRVLSLRQGARRELALPSGGPSRRVVGSRAVLCSSGGRGPARLFLLLSPLPLESQPQKVTCESRVQELSAACARVREVCGFGSRTPAFRRLGGIFPCGLGPQSSPVLSVWPSTFPSTVYQRDCLFSSMYSWVADRAIIDHVCARLECYMHKNTLLFLKFNFR